MKRTVLFLVIISLSISFASGQEEVTSSDNANTNQSLIRDVIFYPETINWEAGTNDIQITERDEMLRYSTNDTIYTIYSISNSFLTNDGRAQYIFRNNELIQVRYRISHIKQFRFSTKTGIMEEKDYLKLYFKTKTNLTKTWGKPYHESDDPDSVNEYAYALSSTWLTDEFNMDMYVMLLNKQPSMSFYFTPPTTLIKPFINYKGYDFRKVDWGMSREAVKLSEPFEPFRSTDKSLIYPFEWDEIDGYIIYMFYDGKLTNGTYYISQNHDNFIHHISDFGNILTRLSDELGEPDGVKYLWKTNIFETNTDWYGLALQEKQLAFTYFWEKKKRHIDLSMFYENNQPVITVRYSAFYEQQEEETNRQKNPEESSEVESASPEQDEEKGAIQAVD